MGLKFEALAKECRFKKPAPYYVGQKIPLSTEDFDSACIDSKRIDSVPYCINGGECCAENCTLLIWFRKLFSGVKHLPYVNEA